MTALRCSLRLVASLCLCLSSVIPAIGQCEPEWLLSGPISGVDLNVFDMLEWDPDGSGPMETSLIVAGLFQNAGNGPANSLARFDGERWQPMAEGLSLSFSSFEVGFVYALEEFQGEVYAGGWFDLSGTTPIANIARWTGTEWVQVGQGISGKVNDLVIFQGKLHAIGVCFLDGVFAPVARLDGNSWTPLVSGLEYQAFAGAVYNNELYVGGDYQELNGVKCNGLVKWDGVAWSVVPGSPSSASGAGVGIGTLGTYASELVVGGAFDLAGGLPANNIARFDGSSWKPLSKGIDNEPLDFFEFNGSLIVSGRFATAGGTPVNQLARWNGALWSPLGNPLAGVDALFAVASYRGDLISSGIFEYKGGVVGRLAGGVWKPLGPGFESNINTITPYQDQAIAVGFFEQTPDGPAKHVARWDGGAWSEVAGGTNAVAYTALDVGTDLYVGGDFTKAGSVNASRIARFDGSTWSSLGSGFNGGVFSLGTHQSELYAGGAFTKSGAANVNRIARWTGSSWVGVGGGPISGFNPDIYSILSFNGQLIVGGGFDLIGTTKTDGIAAWNGNKWLPLGPGVVGSFPIVLDIVEFEDALIACGLFDAAGNTPGTTGVARWNGSTWSALGQGLGFAVNGFCYTMAVHNGELYAGGAFDGTPTAPINAVARWDGTAWRPLGSPAVNGVKYSYNELPFVRAMASAAGELLMGGAFTSAGGKAAGNWARWGCAGPPCLADCDGSGTLNVDDFICFQTLFALSELTADCDQSGTLNIDDFICFQTLFALGC